MRRSSLNRRCDGSRQGFTLVELMVAVMIVGILAALATTDYLRRLPGIRAKQAAQQIWADFKLAQSTAISQKEDVVVQFYPSDNYYTMFIDTGADYSTTNTIVVTGANRDRFLTDDITLSPSGIKVKRLPEGIVFASGIASVNGVAQEGLGTGVKFSNNRIFFQPNGRATIGNADGVDQLPTDDRSNVYVVPAAEREKNNYRNLWAIRLKPIAGIPETIQYTQTKKWREKWD